MPTCFKKQSALFRSIELHQIATSNNITISKILGATMDDKVDVEDCAECLLAFQRFDCAITAHKSCRFRYFTRAHKLVPDATNKELRATKQHLHSRTHPR